MNIISWNVNGIRAILKKDFKEQIKSMNPDILCLQETKAHPDQVDEMLKDYEHHFWNASIRKKGYSGTAIFSKIQPLSVRYGIEEEEHDQEGRVITAEFKDFYLVTVYTPNSGRGLVRLDYRQEWDKAFLKFLKKLEKKKPVITCGDLNVAHTEIDLARPKANYNKSAGFMQEEIDGMNNFINAGLLDSFRYLNPDKLDAYSWWSYRGGARENNVGWRIDYFLVSESYIKNVKKAEILMNEYGSDHCPVSIEI